MRKILIIAALCLCATSASAQEPAPAQPAAPDAKQAERDRKEREKQDAKAVKKEGEYYSVEVSADANFLLRIDKILKATAQGGCNCGENRPPIFQGRDGGSEGGANLEIVEVEVCDLICDDVDFGRESGSPSAYE